MAANGRTETIATDTCERLLVAGADAHSVYMQRMCKMKQSSHLLGIGHDLLVFDDLWLRDGR